MTAQSEVMLMTKSYTAKNAQNDLEVIDWLLRSGSITKEDARWMRNYVQALQ